MKQVLVFISIMVITTYGLNTKEFDNCRWKIQDNQYCNQYMWNQCGEGTSVFNSQSCQYIVEHARSLTYTQEWSDEYRKQFKTCTDLCADKLSNKECLVYGRKLQKCDAKAIAFFGIFVIFGMILML